jgi:signal transduction histidine kinase
LSYILVIAMTIPTLLVVGWIAIVRTPSASGLPPSAQLVQLLENQATGPVRPPGKVPGGADPARSVMLLELLYPPQFLIGLDVNHLLGAEIIDDTGHVRTPFNKTRDPRMHMLFASQQAQVLIHAAFANDQRPSDLVYTFADGQTIAVVPLPDPADSAHPLGVLLVAVSSLSSNANPLLAWFSQIGQQGGAAAILPVAFLLILVTCVISTLFGVVTARRITQRLQRITTAVHGWSRGNFQVAVTDASSDELGQLVQDLNQMARQMQALLEERQQFALLEERQRVARDLHDAVKQQTFALSLLIGSGKKYLEKDPPRAQRFLTEAEELADQTRRELTTIIQELRPLALGEKGLATVLRNYLTKWSQRNDITASVSVQDISFLPPEQEEQLLRVAQEALTNVERHSRANKVSVSLWQETAQVCLVVADNGQGFEVRKAVGTGLGLATMRERIESSQGTVCISSTNEGTKVAVRLPCPKGDQSANSDSNETMIYV